MALRLKIASVMQVSRRTEEEAEREMDTLELQSAQRSLLGSGNERQFAGDVWQGGEQKRGSFAR